ncbi:MAG: hypothetical protein IPM24_14285 [Bryobacterales bacterium]|nr:hypothetical protein [Bryobacterales bacterium]
MAHSMRAMRRESHNCLLVCGLRLKILDQAVEEGLELGGIFDAGQDDVPGEESGDGGIWRRRGLAFGDPRTGATPGVTAVDGDLRSSGHGGSPFAFRMAGLVKRTGAGRLGESLCFVVVRKLFVAVTPATLSMGRRIAIFGVPFDLYT